MAGLPSLALEEVLSLSQEDLQALRMRKLRAQLRRVYDGSPVYKKQFETAGATPDDVLSWADFRKLRVFMSKELETRSQNESQELLGHPLGMHLCVNPSELAYICGTSGSTGSPTFTYLYTRSDLDIAAVAWGRMLNWMGIRPGDRVLHGFGLSMWALGAPLLHALAQLGYSVLPAGAEAGAERLLTLADLFRPKLLMATPSLVEHMIERAPTVIGKEVGALGIERIYCSGEPGASLPAVRSRVRKAYRAELFDAMGGGWGRAAISCASEESHGLHELTPDYIVWADDLVDPSTYEPLEIADGATGKVLTTSLEHQARPVIRYDTGDLVQIFTKPCTCGFRGRRVKVIGRADDMVIVRGVNVYPTAVRNVIAGFAPRCTGQIRVVLTQPPPRVNPPLHVRVECDPSITGDAMEILRAEVVSALRSALRFTAELEFVPAGSLRRSATGKSPLVERRF
jgi:phenylacetate-CoA ligase